MIYAIGFNVSGLSSSPLVRRLPGSLHVRVDDAPDPELAQVRALEIVEERHGIRAFQDSITGVRLASRLDAN